MSRNKWFLLVFRRRIRPLFILFFSQCIDSQYPA